MNPHHFLVGCLRSGTTLLMRIVGAHPQITVVDETQWLPQWYEKRIGLTTDSRVTPELIARLARHTRFDRLGLEPEEVRALVDERHPPEYARFVSDLFDLIARRRGTDLAGEKSPGYVRHLDTIHQLWPDARIVHLIRDGRDVALSVLGWKKQERIIGRFSTWREDPVTTAALWWEWHVRSGMESAKAIGVDRYHEVRYETLVADPGAELERLCTFLEVPFDEAMLRFHEGRTRHDQGLGSKSAWLPVTDGLRSWRTEMDDGSITRFEAAVGPLLDDLGYERRAVITDGEIARADRLRASFAADLRGRGRRVPTAWLGTAA